MLIPISILTIIALELIFPYRKMPVIKKGFWIDLIWYQLLQGFLLQILIFRFIDQFYAAHSLHLISSSPMVVQFIVIFLILDFIGYWLHRTQHQVQKLGIWFWRIHEVHHTTEDLNWLSGSRNHFIEITLGQIVNGAVMVLFGVSNETVVIYSAINSIHGIFFHSNINIRFGVLNYIINTPEMHRIHHLNTLRCQRSNYGVRLAVWDWIFGTAYLPSVEEIKDIPYGLGYDYPKNLSGHLFYLFRKKEKQDE